MKQEIFWMLAKRFLTSSLTLFLLISLVFIVIRLSPGNPTDKYVSAQLGKELSQRIEENFSLNQPVTVQYVSFILNILQGDLGVSYNFRQPVLDVILKYFSFTIIFVLISFVIQIGVGIWLAVLVTKKNHKWLNKIISDLSIFIYSIPAFVLGVGLIYIFSVHLNLFPISGLSSLDYDQMSFISRLADKLYHLVLPVITLSAAGAAMYYKYIKESMDDVLHQSFVLNLLASGLTEKVILNNHVIPNALRPLVSVAGVELGILLGGTLITEVIFSLPGMGRLTIDAILTRDYPLVIGCVLVAGSMMIVTNLVADLIKLKLDKRLLKGILS